MVREELYDFPVSSDWSAFYREQEGGPIAVGSHGQEPPPPLVRGIDPAVPNSEVTVKIFVPAERIAQKKAAPKLQWKPK